MQSTSPPNTAELREALGRVLAQNDVRGLPIVAFERRPSAYRSSFPLEEIRVSLADGAALEVIFKDISRESLPETVRQAKPEFLYDPLREIETYRQVLADRRLGTAHCYGAVVDNRAGRYWLFLEKVAGAELYKIGEFSTWEHTARWLAVMHHDFAAQFALTPSQPGHWLKYDPDYYRLWMRRAQEFSTCRYTAGAAGARRDIERLAARYDEVVEQLSALPTTFIHGEFYASNVLVGRNGTDLRVCPIDWEMAALGPGLIDLAAFVSGRWTDSERTALMRAYHASLTDAGGTAPPEEKFFEAVDDCRLHLAVQWLGWSGNWTPPKEHAQDWLGEALHLAEKRGKR